MFKTNEGNLDRVIRGVVSIVAMIGAYLTTGPIQTGLIVLAIAMAFTAVTGFCGLYTLLGINTCPMKKK